MRSFVVDDQVWIIEEALGKLPLINLLELRVLNFMLEIFNSSIVIPSPLWEIPKKLNII